MSERRYDDREVARIVAGAADREAVARQDPARDDGLTLRELESVAAEAGLEPALVRQAAAQLDARRAATPGDRWRGGPTVLVVERVVDGEPPPDAGASLLAAVRRATGVATGATGATGALRPSDTAFDWHGRLDGAQADVTVTPVDGRTTISVRLALDGVSQASFGRWFLGAGGGLGAAAFAALLHPIGAAAALVGGAIAGAGYVAARRDFARTSARYAARATALADALAASIRTR